MPTSAAVWVYELAGGKSMRQLTVGGKSRHPIWSRDGQWVAFQSDREGDLGIFRQRADGSGVAERLTKPEGGRNMSRSPGRKMVDNCCLVSPWTRCGPVDAEHEGPANSPVR